jgi:ankyrin repeat protein
MALVLALLTTTLATADDARARKTLEERLVPLTPAELLQRAARDDVEVLGLLLEAGVRPDAADQGGFRAGWMALHHASRRDRKALAPLLKAGAPVNAQAKNGMTALCVAVGEGYPSNVADLLAARAEANPRLP